MLVPLITLRAWVQVQALPYIITKKKLYIIIAKLQKKINFVAVESNNGYKINYINKLIKLLVY